MLHSRIQHIETFQPGLCNTWKLLVLGTNEREKELKKHKRVHQPSHALSRNI